MMNVWTDNPQESIIWLSQLLIETYEFIIQIEI
ncbi:hypothetical protein HNR31_001471 [Anoxybacillus caldiproteolyticus]|uniref:Uncharacterized protein n=1 Tax=Thermaerobacillus caldiproteolyticus TaxID=247480 RepID=A0A7V9Z609_9BACL|nr:hypothetical protein [Anoxybacillus caldiproteolyticus]